ncbi:hypothetical protein NG798_27760, partial [Ancylothrix sp. C2]|uniref:hypothetical protein n=1 Tax=Ancylothrix sp. D3o TaxID=2953691 RepID=UPI0021BB9E8A
EDVALHIVTDYTGLINNAMKAASNVEHEVEHIQKYASETNKGNYIKEVSIHFKKLVGEQLEISEKIERGEELKPTDKLYPPEVLEKMTVIADMLDTSSHHSGANSVLSTAEYYKHSHDAAKNGLYQPPTLQQVEMGLETYRQLLHDDVVQKLAYQNQIAVDAFKSARQPDLEEIDFYKKIPHKKPSHVGRMKDPNIYKLGNEITPNGYDAKQLLLTTLNPIISEASVEIAPNDQFRNLFPNPDNCDNPPYNTDHKVMAINAKKNFDTLFNIAVESSTSQRTEKGPVMECTTKQGNKFTIYNIGQFGIIDIKAGLTHQELNLTFKEDYQNRIMALVPVVDPTTGKSEQKQIGFVRAADAKSLNICGNDGINKTTVPSYFIGPSYTEEQTKALFEEAKQYALSVREWSIQNNCLTEMAAATWDVCTGTNNISQVQKESSRQSNQNFMYQAFEQEYLERLQTFQFTSLKLVGQNHSELNKSEHLDPQTYNF